MKGGRIEWDDAGETGRHQIQKGLRLHDKESEPYV